MKPWRSQDYLNHVRKRACLRCNTPGPSDPHHCGPRGMGQKTDDFRTVPLCRACHNAFHAGEWGASTEDRLWIARAQVSLMGRWLVDMDDCGGVWSDISGQLPGAPPY